MKYLKLKNLDHVRQPKMGMDVDYSEQKEGQELCPVCMHWVAEEEIMAGQCADCRDEEERGI